MSYLKIDHVDKVFHRGSMTTDVLRGITLDLERGEYVSIIGHSGCGKSTLLNIVAGLTDATVGGIILEGKQVDAPGPDRAVVFQNHSLLPWLTAYDNVRLAVDKVFSRPKAAPNATPGPCTICASCTWTHAARQTSGELSGG